MSGFITTYGLVHGLRFPPFKIIKRVSNVAQLVEQRMMWVRVPPLQLANMAINIRQKEGETNEDNE